MYFRIKEKVVQDTLIVLLTQYIYIIPPHPNYHISYKLFFSYLKSTFQNSVQLCLTTRAARLIIWYVLHCELCPFKKFNYYILFVGNICFLFMNIIANFKNRFSCIVCYLFFDEGHFKSEFPTRYKRYCDCKLNLLTV